MIERVHINNVDLSYAKSFRIPCNHIHLGYMWPCAFDFCFKKKLIFYPEVPYVQYNFTKEKSYFCYISLLKETFL